MRVPNASVPLMARESPMAREPPVQHHPAPPHPYSRHPSYAYDDEDDEEPPQSRPRSGPDSRRSRSRRDVSPQSHHYRSTPVSRRSPRTSVSESEYETDVTMDSEDERHVRPPPHHGKSVDVGPVSHSLMHERLNRNRVIYEEEEAVDDRPESSYPRPRSPSRQPSRRPSHHHSQKSSGKQDRIQYQRPRNDYREEDDVVDDEPSHYAPRRPSRIHPDHEREGFAPRPPSIKRAHTTAGGSHMASSHSLGSSTRRSTFDNTFGFPLHQPVPDRSARLVSCVVCKDKIGSPRETTSLECGHHMCNHCLKHSFRVSLTDPKALAPRCCKVDIPPKHVAKLFDSAFHHDWHQKFSERPSPAPPRGRLFCPSPRCGTVIRNEDIRHDGGHRHGRCSRCKTKVCCVCHEHWHHPRDCPGEVDADRSFEPARVEDRTLQQRCHRCDTVVDFKEGRSHMTCNRCGAESCTACGDRYKACNCPPPWFDESLEAEPAEYMDVPAIAAVTARPNPFGGRAGHAKRFDTAPQSPRAFRSDADIQLTNSLRPRPSSFEEAAMLHRLQERREPKHARPFADFPDHDREPAPARERAPRTRRTVGEEYRRRPATVVVSPPPQMQMHAPPPPHSAYDGPISAYDYAGAGRAPRGIRYASPERWQAASRPASPDRDSRWHIPSRIHSRAQSRAPSRPPSRPMSPEGLTWGGPSRQQSPERGRWRSHSRAQSADRGALWRARSVGAPIYDSPDRERSPSAETHRHPSRYPSRAPSRAASRAPSRVISRAPSPPDTRRVPSPPASRRAPSPVRSMRSRRAPSRARTQRAPSPPGTHRSPSPDQRRSHTPARSRAQTPDRRRSHTPDARRTSSLDHLADRFNPEIRGSTPGMAGALAPLGYMGMGHMGLMNMMSPPPPPPSYAATQSGYAPTQLGHLPMVPVPPPAASGGRRHNMMDEEVYSSIPGHRGAARSPGGLTKFPHEQEPVVSPIDAAVNAGLPYAPHVRRRPPQATRVHGHEPPKPSVLAGLAGPGRGLNRVFEWRNYVEPGIPEGEHPPPIVAQ